MNHIFDLATFFHLLPIQFCFLSLPVIQLVLMSVSPQDLLPVHYYSLFAVLDYQKHMREVQFHVLKLCSLMGLRFDLHLLFPENCGTFFTSKTTFCLFTNFFCDFSLHTSTLCISIPLVTSKSEICILFSSSQKV